MIQKTVKQMLTAQILSAMTVSLCLLIDNVMIGRFLGEHSLTAYGLASPVLFIMGAVGNMLSAGAQVACGKSIGRGDKEETDACYASSVAIGGLFSLVFLLLALLLRVPISRLLGADDPALVSDTSRYIAGFSIGAPASAGALVLVPFMQMAGQSGLLIVAVLSMTLADVAFDLLNIFVFRGGMFGMGLASALSYYVAVVIGASYFLSKNCVYSFSPRRIQWRKMKELISGGIPSLVGMASSVVMIFGVNLVLLQAGGGAAVAAFSVVNTIMNTVNSISAGSGSVALTLSGVLYSRKDRKGLSELLGALVRSSIVLGAVATALMLLFARPCVELFLPVAGETRTMAVMGLRVFSTALVFCCLSNVLRGCYQGTGRTGLMEVISVLDNAVLPILSAFLLSLAAGVDGAWFLFVTSEVLTLSGILACAWLKNGGVTFRAEDVLLLRKDLGTYPGERTIS